MNKRSILPINKTLRFLVMSAVLMVVCSGYLFAPPAISLKVTGKWQFQLRATDLTGGAGSDFESPFESAVDEVDLTITKTQSPTTPWRIDVRKTDVSWDASLLLYVKRSSDGTGDGTITGGTSYVLLTAVDQTLCTGTDDRSKFGMQYQIEGFTAANLTVASYETTITYTVVET